MKELVTAYRIPLTFIIVLFMAASLISISFADETQRQTVIIFPIAVGNGTSATNKQLLDQASYDLSLLISEGLTESKQYAIVAYTPQLPSLKRAVHDLKIKDKELYQQIDTNTAGADKARMLARFAGADIAIIGSIDGYTTGKGGSAELTVTTQMLEVNTDKVSTTTVTGNSKKAVNAQDQDEESLIISATYDVSQKILSELASTGANELTGTPAPGSAKPAHRSDKNKSFMSIMLGALALGFLIAH